MIPFFTLERQNKILEKELNQTVKEVIDKGNFILGEKVTEFEESFAEYVGVKYAVGVASGTDAISLALLSVGIKSGDEVVMPANAYPTAFAVTAIGAIPQLVDIDPLTFNIDPLQITGAISKRTKAIIAVHLYGQPADMLSIMKIGGKFNIPVVEDCAQAHGAKVGNIGDVGCFSFYPTKNLGCFGDGGMVVTNNEEIYEKVKLLRMYGEKERYNSVLLGRNSRLDELQAAILLVKLKYLDKWNKRRREVAKIYSRNFAEVGKVFLRTSQTRLSHFMASTQTGGRAQKTYLPAKFSHPVSPAYSNSQLTTHNLQLPFEAPYAKHVYHLFVIRTKKRDQLKTYLEKLGIRTAIHYPTPIHLQPSFKYLGYKKGDFPVSEKVAKEILSLPCFPELTDKEVKIISNAIIDFYNKSR